MGVTLQLCRAQNFLHRYFPEKFRIVNGIILCPGSFYIQVNSVCKVEKMKFELRIKNTVCYDMEYCCVGCLAVWLVETYCLSEKFTSSCSRWRYYFYPGVSIFLPEYAWRYIPEDIIFRK